MQFITFAASSIIDLNDQNSEPINVEDFDPDKLTFYLDLDQTELITCLLLDQLVKIESAEGELNSLMNSYADLLVQVKSGRVRDSRFLEELESLKEVIKDQTKYVTIIDTIIAIWNV